MTLSSQIAEDIHLNEEELAKFLISATKEVLGTMVMMEVEGHYPLTEPVTKFQYSVSGMVGLAGIYSGLISVHCPQTLALKMTSNMLGMDVEEVGDDVDDALGEIANMLGGCIKQVLSKGGHDISLSIPTVISGGEYVINVMSEKNTTVVPFSCGEEHFLVGLTLIKE